MPLALELAAARTSALAPAQIAARLDDALRVLGRGSRSAVTRQQTLHATLAWSHDLLERGRAGPVPAPGGLRRQHDAGGGGAGLRRRGLDVVDLLSRLVDKSLVQAEHAERDRALPPAGDHPAVRRPATAGRRRAGGTRPRPPRLVPGVRRGARPGAGRRRRQRHPAGAGRRARQPAGGAVQRAGRRPSGGVAARGQPVALLAGARAFRRGQPLAGGDPGGGAGTDAVAGQGAARPPPP